MDGEGEVDWFGCVISEVDAYQLKLDGVWRNNIQYADVRGDKNRIFTGALGYLDGIWVYVYRGVKFSGRLGSFLRPEAQVSGAINAAVTTITVGTNANVNYTKFFPATGTLLIDNEQMTYTGLTNNTFTGLSRGANGTTAASHAVGALVTQNNLGRCIFFGAEIAARAWGMLPTRITDVRDYGYEQGIGIMAYYGQKVIQDSGGKVPNFVQMNTYSPNPNALI